MHSLTDRELLQFDRICCSVAVLQFEIRVTYAQIYSYIYIYKYRIFLWFVDSLKSNCNTATLQRFEKYGGVDTDDKTTTLIQGTGSSLAKWHNRALLITFKS